MKISNKFRQSQVENGTLSSGDRLRDSTETGVGLGVGPMIEFVMKWVLSFKILVEINTLSLASLLDSWIAGKFSSIFGKTEET